MTTTDAPQPATESLVRNDHQSIRGIFQQLCLTRTYAEVGQLVGMSTSWVEVVVNGRRPGSRPTARNVRRIAKVIGYDPERLATMFLSPTEKS